MVEVSRDSVRLLLAAALAFGVPLFHLGAPFLLAKAGPNWGWNDGHPCLLNLLGLLPILAGCALLWWILTTMLVSAKDLPPRVTLGLRPSKLVQSGPYARMRHPIYVAEGCFWIGTALLRGSPVAAVGLAILISVVVGWLIPKEEAALEHQFGDGYRVYREHVPLLPKLGRLPEK
jgi:protein-S-isoprenylcysteine O-methyltransferase Ste14